MAEQPCRVPTYRWKVAVKSGDIMMYYAKRTPSISPEFFSSLIKFPYFCIYHDCNFVTLITKLTYIIYTLWVKVL